MQLKVPLLHVRRKQHLANFMYEPAQMPKFVHNRNLLTRNGDTKLFKVLQPSKEKTKKAILFKGSSLWNSLSYQHQRVNNYKSFKFITKREIVS